MHPHNRWRVALLLMPLFGGGMPLVTPVVGLAASHARADPAAARTLLTAMMQVQPARAEAASLLSAMGFAP